MDTILPVDGGGIKTGLPDAYDHGGMDQKHGRLERDAGGLDHMHGYRDPVHYPLDRIVQHPKSPEDLASICPLTP